MASTRPAGRIRASLFVLLAFLGTWVGHTLEYLRVSGPGGIPAAMTRSVHVYMLPLGVVLILLALLGGVAWSRSLDALAERLEQLRRALRYSRRVGDSPRVRPGAAGPAACQCSVWMLLGTAQLGLYLVQENVESRLAHLPLPGLGALGGNHWAAAPIQLAVALILAGITVRLFAGRFRLDCAVENHERLLARRWAGRARIAPLTECSVPSRAETPHQRWGAQRWERPPPARLAA